MHFESQRKTIEKLMGQYKAYVIIYKEFNNGSIEGITSFDDFYWMFTYHSCYADWFKLSDK